MITVLSYLFLALGTTQININILGKLVKVLIKLCQWNPHFLLNYNDNRIIGTTLKSESNEV